VRDGETEGTLLERIGYQGLLAQLEDEPWRLAGDQNAKQRFENTQSGYRIATSVGGTATGEGGDVIVIDDPHKADEAESDTVRESVLDWHDGTMATRLNDPKRGARVLIMQRLHHRDLTGHLLEQGEWTHLCLPAQYEPKHPFVWPDDPRTKEGEPLWPDHVPVCELERLERALGSYRAAGQLQQRPAPAEGGILKRRSWRFYDRATEALPHFTTIAQSWDTSFTDTEDSSFVVGQLWGCFGADRYLLHQIRARLDFTQTIREIRKLTAWGERQPHRTGCALDLHREQGQRPGDHLGAAEPHSGGHRGGPRGRQGGPRARHRPAGRGRERVPAGGGQRRRQRLRSHSHPALGAGPDRRVCRLSQL
jgi:hypothetical protein